MGADPRGAEGGATADPAIGARPSIAGARGKLIDGDVPAARVIFDLLAASQERTPELLLTEAMILEAENRVDEALDRLDRIVASTTGSARIVASSHARIARLAMRLGREDLAEASGMATLALDPDDVDGLRALAFARRHDADAEARLRALRRLADAPAAAERDIWEAVDAFEALERWPDVLSLLEQHEFELDPRRTARLRVRALLKLGWHRRAFEQVRDDYAVEYIRANEVVDLLVQMDALALAARFVDEAMSDDPWQPAARASLMSIATRASAAANLLDSPFQFADAIHARDILMPGREPVEAAMGRAVLVFTRNAAKLMASDDLVGAVRMLTAAARLAPTDRSLLEALADAAHRANLTERYLDTLLRIWTTHRDTSALLATARGVLETSSWETISRVMAIATAEAGTLGLDIDAIAGRFLEQACRRADEHIRAGDVAGALELLCELSRQLPGAEWPESLVSRLLRATKRRLRNQRVGGEALIATVGPLFLELAPDDVDVCRMMARVRLRQRRLTDAEELLSRVVAISPHVADDWVALAAVQNELGDLEARDVSIARAIVIAPDDDLPAALTSVRVEMEAV
jgi:tetratricopeptide (TPR) repeat protein